MQKQKASYEALLAEVVETLKHSPEELEKILETSGQVIAAANDLTQDELALISAYIKADLKAFSEQYQQSTTSPFYLMIVNSLWQGLLDITDRTKVEWVELFQDLEHQGIYHAGELIGLGHLICEHCNHKIEYNHPTEIVPCLRCGHKLFTRQPLQP